MEYALSIQDLGSRSDDGLSSNHVRYVFAGYRRCVSVRLLYDLSISATVKAINPVPAFQRYRRMVALE